MLVSTPSYALAIAQAVKESGGELALELGLFGGEPWSEGLRVQIEARARAHGHQLLWPVGDVRTGGCH